MGRKIAVLGGGYSGVLTAKHLEKSLRKSKITDVSVTLIDKNPYHTMLTELHEVAANRVEEDSIKMDLTKIFEGRNVNVVLDNITNIDFDGNKLVGELGTYDYDYLVLGSGSKPTYFGTTGAEENSFSLWSFDDAVKLKIHILDMFRKAEGTTNKELRKELLSFYVVGGGFTGVEMIGELAEWVPHLCKEYHIDKSEVQMVLVDMMPRILNAIPESLSEKASRRMTKMGIIIKPSTAVTEVGSNFIGTKSNDVESKSPSRTVIWAAGIEGSEIVKSTGIGCPQSRGNRVEVTPTLQHTEYKNVFVVGDNMFYIPEGEKMSVPQMVENCEASAKTASHNIMADIKKEDKKEAYNPKFHGMMVCIGGRYGVAYVGSHTKKFALPSFFAMLSKHFINIIYFLQVLGWNKTWSYLKHEIFAVRDNRSFVGGHFSNNAPTFWALLLRLFLGFNWLLEGIIKMEKITQNFNNIFLFTITPEKMPDGVTSASAEVTQNLPSFIYTLNSFNFGEVEGVKALPVPGFMANIVNWSMDTMVAPIAPYVQLFMVLLEIVLGLCLLAGLFTSMISIVSAMFCLMIYSSGMANKEILWFFTGSVALISIGGTGQAFSFDYYVLPWLKEKWSNLKFVKKWYIYND